MEHKVVGESATPRYPSKAPEVRGVYGRPALTMALRRMELLMLAGE